MNLMTNVTEKNQIDIMSEISLPLEKSEWNDIGIISLKCSICKNDYTTNSLRYFKHHRGTTCSKKCSYVLRGQLLATRQSPPYIYNCVKCSILVEYRDYYTFLNAKTKHALCRQCRRKKYIRYCPKCNMLLEYTNASNLRRANKNNTVCRGCTPKPISYNPLACKIFDAIDQELGWNGQHALKIGEKKVLNYWVDYYEPNENIVIEFDEKHHKFPYHKRRDEKRQRQITEHLNCKFFRINDGDDWHSILALDKTLLWCYIGV